MMGSVFICNLTSRGCSLIAILGMTLIDLPLSEFVTVSEVVDNMSYYGDTKCVLFDILDFRIIIAAVVCSTRFLFISNCILEVNVRVA